jgi:hypothetical protein
MDVPEAHDSAQFGVPAGGGERGPRPAPFTLEPAQAFSSLHKLDGIEAAWLLPGHGTPWTSGVAKALRQIRTTRT